MTTTSTPNGLVSVVIGTKDRRASLARTLSTVLGQTHRDLEVIVVDDGSVDGTSAFLAAHPDPRVHGLRHDRSRGVACARNTGLTHARGDFVAFTDDDDLWAPEKLTAQLRALDATGSGWSCVTTIVVDDDLCPVGWQRVPGPVDVERTLLSVDVIPGGASGVVARTALVRQLGGFDPAFQHFADWDLWIRLGRLGPPASVDRPLLAYLRHDGMSTVPTGKLEDTARIEQKHRDRRTALGAEPPAPHTLRWIGETALRIGDRRGALRSYREAAQLSRSPRAGLRYVCAHVPGFLRARDVVQYRSAPRRGREEAERWLEPIRSAGALVSSS